ncbi:hypothetical protein OG21DRAFT_1484265 [Imleria badia]|nr:hypothetical protein OG21DRAFT_1484265 [Imleria badia]
MGTTTIGLLPSFLPSSSFTPRVFFLAHRDLDHFSVPFATLFLDHIRHMDAQWPLLVACIRDGTVPDLQSIDHIRGCLQPMELLDISPPSSREGWFTHMWPSASVLSTGLLHDRDRHVLSSSGYRASEATIGLPHDPTKPDEFVPKTDSVVEFLDISRDETHQELS